MSEEFDAVRVERFALLSGGHDSLAATHYAMAHDLADVVLHLDTTTGVPANQRFVEDVAEEFGWTLRIERAPVTLYEFAVKYGFPGTAAHSWAYRYFKERQLQRVAGNADGKPRYVTGVRRHESERRMRTVTGEWQEADRWTWHAPIYDWRDGNVEDYIQDHGLPSNPVVKKLHRSGECNCGSFAYRDEELVVLKAEFPEFAEWLLTLEGYVQQQIGQDEPYCWWGHGGMPSPELRALMARHDTPQMTLCEACGVDEEPAEPTEVPADV